MFWNLKWNSADWGFLWISWEYGGTFPVQVSPWLTDQVKGCFFVQRLYILFLIRVFYCRDAVVFYCSHLIVSLSLAHSFTQTTCTMLESCLTQHVPVCGSSCHWLRGRVRYNSTFPKCWLLQFAWDLLPYWSQTQSGALWRQTSNHMHLTAEWTELCVCTVSFILWGLCVSAQMSYSVTFFLESLKYTSVCTCLAWIWWFTTSWTTKLIKRVLSKIHLFSNAHWNNLSKMSLPQPRTFKLFELFCILLRGHQDLLLF